jgi:hypothetical protein
MPCTDRNTRRGRDELAFRGGTLMAGEFGLQQFLQLRVPAITADIEETVIHGQTQGVSASLQQERGNRDLIFSNGEIDWRPIGIVASHE